MKSGMMIRWKIHVEVDTHKTKKKIKFKIQIIASTNSEMETPNNHLN